ncbi:hypothetical protein ACZ90_50280 [Streptomyces albus subsp. albus]|nr:hypothetical protein ACZ90_50280 [Streptomyces albus subsp. albus]
MTRMKKYVAAVSLAAAVAAVPTMAQATPSQAAAKTTATAEAGTSTKGAEPASPLRSKQQDGWLQIKPGVKMQLTAEEKGWSWSIPGQAHRNGDQDATGRSMKLLVDGVWVRLSQTEVSTGDEDAGAV